MRLRRRGRGARVQRFRIARGAVANIRPYAAALLAAVPIALVALPLLLVTLGAAASAFPLGVAALLASVLGVVFHLNLPGHVLLGEDGVYVDTRDQRRFVPFAEITEVGRHDETMMGKKLCGIALSLRDGERMILPFGEDQLGASERLAILLRALEDGLAGFRARSFPADVVGRLAPGPLPTDRWAEQLRRLGAGAEAGHRIAPVPIEQLWRVVEDPSADATSRAGAAFALRAHLDAPSKARLRAAADAIAAPALLSALEAAAEEEEEAAIEALEGVRRAP